MPQWRLYHCLSDEEKPKQNLVQEYIDDSIAGDDATIVPDKKPSSSNLQRFELKVLLAQTYFVISGLNRTVTLHPRLSCL